MLELQNLWYMTTVDASQFKINSIFTMYDAIWRHVSTQYIMIRMTMPSILPVEQSILDTNNENT